MEHCATVQVCTNSPKNRETPGNLPPLKAFLENLVSITNCGRLDWLPDIAADRSGHPTANFWKPGLLEDPPQIISTGDSVETVCMINLTAGEPGEDLKVDDPEI
jgi:hypothetical protein